MYYYLQPGDKILPTDEFSPYSSGKRPEDCSDWWQVGYAHNTESGKYRGGLSVFRRRKITQKEKLIKAF